MNENEERIARTEALFRDVNERIAETARRFDSQDGAFVCECADQTCTERVDATLDEYERARAKGTRFLLRRAMKISGSSALSSDADRGSRSSRRSTRRSHVQSGAAILGRISPSATPAR